MKRKDKPLSWKPVRKGLIYCAPACGSGCTRAEFDKATLSSAALAKRMGPRWKPEVWENLGWHWAVRSPCGRMKVHPVEWRGSVTYTAYLGEAGEPGGTWAEHGLTPEAAVQATLAAALNDAKKIAGFLAGLVPDAWLGNDGLILPPALGITGALKRLTQ